MEKPDNEEVMEIMLEDLLKDPDVISYVQVKDDDGNVIEERPATEEEIRELFGGV